MPELTNHQDCQNNTVEAISSLRSPRSLPELPNCPLSSPTRCAGTPFQPKVAQNPARAPKVLISIAKAMPWDPFQARSHPEAYQSSQAVHFHRENDALGAISSPWSPRSPPELPNYPFSSPKRRPGARNDSQGIVLAMRIDGLGALAGSWVPWGWKWLPGHRFGNENRQFGGSGGQLGTLGLEMAPRGSFWQ